MKNLIYTISIAAFSVSIFGCSMCCGPNDFDYPTYGGKYQRSDPVYGRVGSPFSDPGTTSVGPSADSNLSDSGSSRLREPNEEFEAFEELEDIDNLFNDDLNQDNDLNDPNLGPQDEKLPAPGASPQPESDESTASRNWKQQPLRNRDQWR